MIEEYIFKTVISFISIKASIYIMKDSWNKLSTRKNKNSFIKRNMYTLFTSAIPIFRWVMVFLILVIGFLLGNDEFAEKVRKEDDK